MTGVAVLAAVVGLAPVIVAAGGGRWGLADTGYAQPLPFVSPSGQSGRLPGAVAGGSPRPAARRVVDRAGLRLRHLGGRDAGRRRPVGAGRPRDRPPPWPAPWRWPSRAGPPTWGVCWPRRPSATWWSWTRWRPRSRAPRARPPSRRPPGSCRRCWRQSDLTEVSSSGSGFSVFENTRLPARAGRADRRSGDGREPAGRRVAHGRRRGRHGDPVLPGSPGSAWLRRSGVGRHGVRRLRPGRPLAPRGRRADAGPGARPSAGPPSTRTVPAGDGHPAGRHPALRPVGRTGRAGPLAGGGGRAARSATLARLVVATAARLLQARPRRAGSPEPPTPRPAKSRPLAGPRRLRTREGPPSRLTATSRVAETRSPRRSSA